MPKLYRIVDEDGNGMYNVPHCSGKKSLVNKAGIRNFLGTDDRHPSPDEDGGLEEVWTALRNDFSGGRDNGAAFEYLFAFGSIEQLRSWVYKSEWIHLLHQHGGRLLVVEYNDEDEHDDMVKIGWTQAIFHKSILDRHEHYYQSLLSVLEE